MSHSCIIPTHAVLVIMEQPNSHRKFVPSGGTAPVAMCVACRRLGIFAESAASSAIVGSGVENGKKDISCTAARCLLGSFPDCLAAWALLADVAGNKARGGLVVPEVEYTFLLSPLVTTETEDLT